MPRMELKEKWSSQVKKGLLDFLILLYLKSDERYGYELIRDIKEEACMDISEGTIYPLLNRLMNDEMVTSRWVEKSAGIPRKYYKITKKGRAGLDEMKRTWLEITGRINIVMEKRW